MIKRSDWLHITRKLLASLYYPHAVNQWQGVKYPYYLVSRHGACRKAVSFSPCYMSARSEFDYQFLIGSKSDYQLWKIQLYMYTSRATGNSHFESYKFPRQHPQFPKIPVVKNIMLDLYWHYIKLRAYSCCVYIVNSGKYFYCLFIIIITSSQHYCIVQNLIWRHSRLVIHSRCCIARNFVGRQCPQSKCRSTVSAVSVGRQCWSVV